MSRIVRISNGNYKLYVNPNGTISFNASEIDLNGEIHITGGLFTDTISTTNITVNNNAIVQNLKVISDEIDFNTDAKIVYQNSSFKLTNYSNTLTKLTTGDVDAQNVTTTSLIGSPVLINDSLRIASSSTAPSSVTNGLTLYTTNGELHYVYGLNSTYVSDQFISKSKAIIYSMIF